MIKKLFTTLACLILCASLAFAYTGAGSIWAQKGGDFVSKNFSGDASGLAAAYTYCGSNGFIQLGPGLEGLSLGTVPTGVTVARSSSVGWETSRTGNTINIHAFGAKGDGVTDDTAPVLAALVATPANGTLYFPSGTYLLSTWTVQALSKVVSIYGDGIQKSIVRGTSGQSFLSCTKDIHVSRITFDTWTNVFDFSSVASVLENVTFEDMEITNYTKGLYGSSATAGVGITNLKVLRSRFENGIQYPIFFNLAKLEYARIADNKSRISGQRAINLGNNTKAFENDRGFYEISGNMIDSVTANEPNASIAIDVYGWRAVIDGNIIRNVYQNDAAGAYQAVSADADGIYTKCRYSTIKNNVLIDAGMSEGFINVKGTARHETITTSPLGYAVVVEGNMLFETGTSGRKSYGIKLATSEVQVVNNYFEGFTAAAITTDGDSSSNYVIAMNLIKNIRGTDGIQIFGGGRNIRVQDNMIDSVGGTYPGSGQNTGILVSKNGGGGVDISRNRIRNIRDYGQTPVGILIKPSVVINAMRVEDNDIDSAYYAVQFANNAPNDVFVRHNTYRNIIGTPAIKYSVTPTALVDISADPPVVTYEQTDRAAIYNGTTLQQFRVYGTRTDLSNYERVALVTGTTAFKLLTEFAGTGSARPLELGSGGATQWRIESNGNFTPLADKTYDIGTSTTAHVRAGYFSKASFDSINSGKGIYVGGQFVEKMILPTILTFPIGSVGAQATFDTTLTVSGVDVASKWECNMSPVSADMPSGVAIGSCRVSADNVVKVRFLNTSLIAANIPSQTWRVRAFK